MLQTLLHAQNIYKLASHKIYVLLKIRPYITEKVALRIYKTKILPYIDYGDIFYMSTTNEVLDKLDKLQYRALRICLGTTYRTPRVELIQRTQIPLLRYRRMAHLRNFMYKRSWDQQYIASVPGRTRVYDGGVRSIATWTIAPRTTAPGQLPPRAIAI